MAEGEIVNVPTCVCCVGCGHKEILGAYALCESCGKPVTGSSLPREAVKIIPAASRKRNRPKPKA